MTRVSPKYNLIKPRVRRGQPTVLQIKALQYISQGYSERRAMKMAGYAPATYNRGGQLLKKEGVQKAIESMLYYLEKKQVTVEKLADKVVEFIDAKDAKGNPNYPVQIQGVKMARDEMSKAKDGDSGKQKKREVTWTEWVGSEDARGEQDA